MPKPHIVRWKGIWLCRVYVGGERIGLRPVGHGYTPSEALMDWIAQA